MELSSIPRSVRWRIKLGVYRGLDPSDCNDCSTTEILDLIYRVNKDIIMQQNDRFQSLMEKYVEEEEERGHEEEADAVVKAEEHKAPDLDPLTAMVLEQEAIENRKAELLLRYKKERARRKRGLTTEGRQIGDESDGIDQASLGIIEKDLKRLPHPTSKGGPASGNLTPEEESRITNLKEILYIYAQEHPKMGYRQGMHEIASYLLYALETDQPEFQNNPLFESILPTCFALLEATLEQLHLAYDASGEQAFQRMSHSILGKVQQNDPVLFRQLTTSPHIPPPQIYCTRWVRLLFSREVVGFDNVFQLWDTFFDFNPEIMRALEVTSAARVLLLRDALLNPENSPLDLLMNVPPMEDLTPLTDLLKKLMEQKESDQPIEIPASHMVSVAPRTPPKQGHGMPPPMTTPGIPHSISTLGMPPPMATPQMIPRGPITQTPSGDSNGSIPSTNGVKNGSNNFSFSKMRHSLGQKGESIRKKILTATNEWKRENSGGGGPPSYSVGTDIFSHAGEAIRQNAYNRNPIESLGFIDPLRNPSSPAMPEPPSPRKHQHGRWAQVLKERVMVVQQYLMAVEANEHTSSKVPPEVWEAMADMQRMQQELHNYSVNMS